MVTQSFRTEKISEHITRIYAFSSELMYLVEGSRRAALLDSGSGIGSLLPVIKELTEKPTTVLLTHGHVDHAMGASEFSHVNVFINKEDSYIYHSHSTYEFRKAGLFLMEDGCLVTEDDFTPVVPIDKYRNLNPGDTFDLGGIHVEMLSCPGHTKGSLVMRIPEERTILLGDACNSFTFLFENYSTSIETYRLSLLELQRETKGSFDTALASHGDGVLAPEIISENITLCERIMNGTADREPMEFRGNKGFIADAKALPHHGNIVYSDQQIFM